MVASNEFLLSESQDVSSRNLFGDALIVASGAQRRSESSTAGYLNQSMRSRFERFLSSESSGLELSKFPEERQDNCLTLAAQSCQILRAPPFSATITLNAAARIGAVDEVMNSVMSLLLDLKDEARNVSLSRRNALLSQVLEAYWYAVQNKKTSCALALARGFLCFDGLSSSSALAFMLSLHFESPAIRSDNPTVISVFERMRSQLSKLTGGRNCLFDWLYLNFHPNGEKYDPDRTETNLQYLSKMSFLREEQCRYFLGLAINDTKKWNETFQSSEKDLILKRLTSARSADGKSLADYCRIVHHHSVCFSEYLLTTLKLTAFDMVEKNNHEGLDLSLAILPERKINLSEGFGPNRDETILHRAAALGFDKIIRVLNSSDRDVNRTNTNRQTPAHVAIHHGEESPIVQVLKELGADLSLKNKWGETPMEEPWIPHNHEVQKRKDVEPKYETLHEAAEKGDDVESIYILAIVRREDVNKMNRADYTPAHYAAMKNYPKVIRALHECGADLSKQDRSGSTPAHMAAWKNYPKVIRALHECGADLNKANLNNQTTRFGSTPTHVAAWKNSPDAIRALHACGADLNKVNVNNQTPAHVAIHHGEDSPIVQVLKELGADFSLKNKWGETPMEEPWIRHPHEVEKRKDAAPNYKTLHEAALKGDDVESIYILVAVQGKDVDEADSDGETAAHKAAWNDSAEAIRAIHKCGADLNKQNKSGETPAHKAAFSNAVDTIRALHDCGADLDARDMRLSTPTHKAAWHNKPEALRTLHKCGADLNKQDEDGKTPAHWAAWFGDPDAIAALCASGVVDFNLQNKDGDTPLHYVAGGGRSPDFIRKLFEGGANLNTANVNGQTPAHVAIHHGEDSLIVQVLRELGADFRLKNKWGETPAEEPWIRHPHKVQKKKDEEPKYKTLHEAAEKGDDVESIYILVAVRSENVDKVDMSGHTPAHIAAKQYHLSIIRALDRCSADLTIKNNDGQTPIDVAIHHHGKDSPVVQVLEELRLRRDVYDKDVDEAYVKN